MVTSLIPAIVTSMLYDKVLLELSELSSSELIAIITSIATLIQISLMAYQSMRKNKPEVKKLEVEGDSEIVDAAHVNMESAEISTKLLLARIEELKKDVEAEKKARQEDRQYFNRRVRDLDKELRDYRNWAAGLAKQVIQAGKQPIPFLSSLNDSDPLIVAITKEQEQLEQTKQVREEEIKKETRKE